MSLALRLLDGHVPAAALARRPGAVRHHRGRVRLPGATAPRARRRRAAAALRGVHPGSGRGPGGRAGPARPPRSAGASRRARSALASDRPAPAGHRGCHGRGPGGVRAARHRPARHQGRRDHRPALPIQRGLQRRRLPAGRRAGLGLLAGLSGADRLEFTQRITEGAPPPGLAAIPAGAEAAGAQVCRTVRRRAG